MAAAIQRLLLVVVCLAAAVTAINTRKLDTMLQRHDEQDSGSLSEFAPLALLETGERVRECEMMSQPSIFPAATASFIELPTPEEIEAEFRGERPVPSNSHNFVRFRADSTSAASSQSLQPPATVIGTPGSPPVAVMLSKVDPLTGTLVADTPSNLPPPPPVDPRSFYRPLANPQMGLSCCQGMPCQYHRGVCCNTTAFCCPHMSECVETTNARPTCVEIPPQPALKQKIVSIEVINADGSRSAAIQDGQDGQDGQVKGSVLTVDDVMHAQQEVLDNQNRLAAQEMTYKRQQEQAQKFVKMAADDQAKADAEVAKLTARKQDAIEQVMAMIKKAVDNLDAADRNASAFNATNDLSKLKGGTVSSDVDLPPQGTPEQLAQFGQPWPPLSSVINDGLGGIFVRQAGVDWTGGGLIRNGTYNVVTTPDDCKSQCESLPECRVVKYVTNTAQCWMDSDLARAPSACPLVNGQRACVSFVKKTQKWDNNYEYGVTSSKDDAFEIYDQENRLGQGNPKNGGRLLRNGRRNTVDNLTACIKQCASLKYCVSMVYFRPNGECWLSSANGEQRPSKCARRAGRRDCISYIKKKVNPERAGKSNMLLSDSGRTKSVSITNHGDSQSSTFSINLPV